MAVELKHDIPVDPPSKKDLATRVRRLFRNLGLSMRKTKKSGVGQKRKKKKLNQNHL